jgi:basic membrane protein A
LGEPTARGKEHVVSVARWTTLAVVALLVAAFAGCGSGESGTDVKKVALVTPGADNDPDWSIQASAVVEEFPEKLGVRADVADASQADDVRAVLEQVSHEGNQLVIAHDSRYADAAEAVAEDSGVAALVWGERADPPDGLVGELTVEDKEGGYLAGITATMAAYTRRLAVVVADDGSDWDLATWNRMAGGFVAGARSVDPDAQVGYAQVGEDGDATAAAVQRATARLLEDGAQMVLILGGAASLGAQRAVEARRGHNETLFITAVSDRSTTRKLEPGSVPYMLGSLVWDLRGAYRRAIRDLRAGTFGDHPYALTLANGGVELYQTGRMPHDAYEAAIEAGERIDAGKIDVPVTPTREAVEQLIAEEGGGAEG